MSAKANVIDAFTDGKRIGLRIKSSSSKEWFSDFLAIMKFTLKCKWEPDGEFWYLPLTMPRLRTIQAYLGEYLDMSVALGAWEADRKLPERLTELEKQVEALSRRCDMYASLIGKLSEEIKTLGGLR